MTTTINTDHPLFNTNAERMRINAVLRHLGSGADLREFPAAPSEKVALVKTANQRGLIAWHKGRNRYELTPAGWCELAPSRRYGVGSMMLGTTLGASLGAAALAVLWFTAGAAHGPAPSRPAAPSMPAQVANMPVQVAKLSTPAVTGAVSSAAPVASEATPEASTTAAAASPPPEPAATAPARETAAPARETAPAAAPIEAERTKVAEAPTPEQQAEAAKAKQAAAKKARQRAAARQRRREDAARAWAAEEPRSRQAEYSGHGVYGGYGGYNGYGGGNSWFAYR